MFVLPLLVERSERSDCRIHWVTGPNILPGVPGPRVLCCDSREESICSGSSKRRGRLRGGQLSIAKG